jgi:formylglycine-generating enzyme required for sulfatase activity
MLIQKGGAGTLPPPGFTPPPWAALSSQWTSIAAPSSPTVLIPTTVVTLGHNDSEADDFDAESGKPNLDVKGHTFGWDNESPVRTVAVGPFRAEWRCITNGEFLRYWKEMEGPLRYPPAGPAMAMRSR